MVSAGRVRWCQRRLRARSSWAPAWWTCGFTEAPQTGLTSASLRSCSRWGMSRKERSTECGHRQVGEELGDEPFGSVLREGGVPVGVEAVVHVLLEPPRRLVTGGVPQQAVPVG